MAVLDTGLAVSGASDGIGCVVAGTDIVNGDSDPDDGDGHGTHVSGTVAQATNSGTGVAGLSYGSCIMPVKVLDDSGSGDFADIAEGVFWAVNAGADVINMNLGTNARFAVTSIPAMDAALDIAYAAGVTVVCASGNDGNRKNVSYPAIYPTTIAVGATDYRNEITRYSNKGTGLDMVAPGGDLGRDDNGDGYGDGVLQETRINGSWAYYFFDGTSMASPHVAAAAPAAPTTTTTAGASRTATATTTTPTPIRATTTRRASGATTESTTTATASSTADRRPPIPAEKAASALGTARLSSCSSCPARDPRIVAASPRYEAPGTESRHEQPRTLRRHAAG